MSPVVGALPRGPERGRPADPGLFGPDSLAWRVNGEVHLRQTGFYERNPWKRLQRTLMLTYALTFGTTDQANDAAASINAVHRTVHGVDAVTGRPYDALDPDLLLWVHATLVDSALTVHDRFVGGLSPSDRERYYRDMKRQAAVLRVPSSILPGNLGEFDRYVRKRVARLEVTDDARRLARDILRPPLPLPLRPVGAAFGLVTASLLPDRLREGYGLPRIPPVDLGLTAAAAVSRRILPLVPRVLRTWPGVTAARRRAASGV